MKKTILFALLTALSTSFIAQISVEEYSRKASVDVSEIGSLPLVKATSECGEVTTKTSDTMMSGGCLGTLVRTYTYTDGCGNTASAEQYINLRDSESPVLHNVPKDIVVASNKIPKAVTVSATDNVGDDEVKVEMSETIDEENHQIIRQWRAFDQCGNSSVARQIITITGV